MTVGLIAGGPGERAVIRILASKVLRVPPGAIPSAFTMGEAELFIAQKVERLARILKDDYSASKLVICVDSHSDDQAAQRKVLDTRRELAKLWGVRVRDLPVDYVLIVHELEGWLLADEDALRAVLGKNAQFNLPYDLESHCRQAQLLAEIFRKNGKSGFQKTKDNLDIANKANPKEIAKRMPSFRQFVTALKDP